MREAVIVDAVRTPVGRHGGALAAVRPDDLAAIAIRALLERTAIEPAAIEDVILGCANGAGEDNRNVGRMAALLALLPVEVPGQTINRLCGSGLQAVVSAAHAIRAGEGDCFIAGGVESMTRSPYVMLKSGEPWNRSPQIADSTLGWRFVNPEMPKPWTISLGETAEVVASRRAISREDQDRFAAESQERAARAMRDGAFADELVPVTVKTGKTTVVVSVDEHPRPDTTLEALAKLKPAFVKDGGTVTAGNSSGINDGAAALLVMAREAAAARGYRPLARVVASAVAGVAPDVMGIGPVPAVRLALKRAGLTVRDLDLVELNEAFAAQSLACVRELELDEATVNVYGGAIALGHPLGASGARILTTLVHALKRRGGRYGLATMCIGVGQGIAMVVEREG
ncbi:MAG: beta-ketoadipyl CoA thiolase [Gemmatimonadetes bacterium GWC2_71_9]|nr:MAG: beta-ketoadipyl CoA thiolase [Gemmatimonadetes bacterium GWC2_71_9]